MILEMTVIMMVMMMVMVMLLASRYVKVPPNQAMVVYGHVFPGGKRMMILTGGGKFILPIIEKFAFLNIGTRTFKKSLPEVKTKDDQLLALDIEISYAIESTEESLENAAEMLLDRSEEDIQSIVETCLEGKVRGICIAFTSTKIVREKEGVRAEIIKRMNDDLGSLGLMVEDIRIQEDELMKEGFEKYQQLREEMHAVKEEYGIHG